VDARISLALRARRGAHVPSATLAAESGLTPAALAEGLAELARRGFVLEEHPMLGVRLVAPPPGLAAEEVGWDRQAARIGRRVRCVETVTSTNDLAWDEVAAGPDAADGLAVFAEFQWMGRGRRGNRWLAPAHSAVLASVLFWTPEPQARAAVLTRAGALAAAEAIEDCCRLAVGIKWPNDLVVEDRKVGGVLVEARPVPGHRGPVVIGTGLNCTQPAEAFPEDLRPRVTSLVLCGEEVDRTLLARALLARLDRIVAMAETPGGEAEIQTRAFERCRTLGRRITLTDGRVTCTGEVLHLDPDYGIVLRLPEGVIGRFPAMTSHVVADGDPGASGGGG